jgi:hypothetical protein
VGLVYVEGHGRVYHGPLGPLPRLYVARQKLRLRGTTDSWVNGLGGEPFLAVTQPLHTGLIAALREQVIPRWLAEAPQPDAGRQRPAGARGVPAAPPGGPRQRGRGVTQGVGPRARSSPWAARCVRPCGAMGRRPRSHSPGSGSQGAMLESWWLSMKPRR